MMIHPSTKQTAWWTLGCGVARYSGNRSSLKPHSRSFRKWRQVTSLPSSDQQWSEEDSGLSWPQAPRATCFNSRYYKTKRVTQSLFPNTRVVNVKPTSNWRQVSEAKQVQTQVSISVSRPECFCYLGSASCLPFPSGEGSTVTRRSL